MSVHDELKKAVNRIAQLEQEVRFHESVVTIQMDEKKKAEDMEAVWREANANLEKACDLAIANMKEAINGKQEAEERLAGFIESDESLRKLNVEQANELQDAVRTAQEFRNQVVFINNKYEVEKFKAESRHQTIDSLLNRIRLVESEHASDAESAQAMITDLSEEVRQLRTRLQIDPGGSDLIDVQEGVIRDLRKDIDAMAQGLVVINARIAYIGHPREEFWMPPSEELKGGETALPDWRKEIALIHDLLRRARWFEAGARHTL